MSHLPRVFKVDGFAVFSERSWIRIEAGMCVTGREWRILGIADVLVKIFKFMDRSTKGHQNSCQTVDSRIFLCYRMRAPHEISQPLHANFVSEYAPKDTQPGTTAY